MADFKNKVHIKNRKASFEYELLDKYIAGLVLKGTEIKSIRLQKVSLQEAYCYFNDDNELYIKNMHIAPYENSSFYQHEPTRERKLLLTKRELRKLWTKTQEKGLTIVPTRLFINDRGFAKVEISLAKGKKIHDKRESIKEKDTKRQLDRLDI